MRRRHGRNLASYVLRLLQTVPSTATESSGIRSAVVNSNIHDGAALALPPARREAEAASGLRKPGSPAGTKKRRRITRRHQGTLTGSVLTTHPSACSFHLLPTSSALSLNETPFCSALRAAPLSLPRAHRRAAPMRHNLTSDGEQTDRGLQACRQKSAPLHRRRCDRRERGQVFCGELMALEAPRVRLSDSNTLAIILSGEAALHAASVCTFLLRAWKERRAFTHDRRRRHSRRTLYGRTERMLLSKWNAGFTDKYACSHRTVAHVQFRSEACASCDSPRGELLRMRHLHWMYKRQRSSHSRTRIRWRNGSRNFWRAAVHKRKRAGERIAVTVLRCRRAYVRVNISAGVDRFAVEQPYAAPLETESDRNNTTHDQGVESVGLSIGSASRAGAACGVHVDTGKRVYARLSGFLCIFSMQERGGVFMTRQRSQRRTV
ncbi:unnamed protein product [Rangifer tarandus platyrhynchus]|uniref:Uncharacterized protein n=1 Tax=Rangifer tarandus platyrhynchus TaxID=3082113 RepID=A0ABN8XIK4_RANTA|nr:unnamed protein product [Rangifer tarandus platyrhynchus]